ncbi:cation:dicarboxylate symporter family transporter [Paraburkholderia rhizosphaerae]|uniref:Aerobic C4-dicarboxylate transport protein n=1 Tax=Paraburkholderia rhizosphaerae TaxID=480658 RepID=A0A4V3HF88_9BURK|nr:cation:dicarboxylase symporter family transporter [Paraburkholderia rhizosphaerae]TDY51961.1 aerobic C4-dicarboxylate transport protein [Paraburkholderia rhizosphaerae]
MAFHTDTANHSSPHAPSAAARKRPPLYARLGVQIVVGIVAGIALGFIAPKLAVDMKILGDIFLRLIKMIVAPLVFLNVVLGIAAAGDLKNVGRIGLRALIYFEIVSTIALAFSMVIANLSNVGVGMHLTQNAADAAAAHAQYGKAAPVSLEHFMLTLFPDNFVGAFANGSLLQVLVISIGFGAAVLMLTREQRSSVEHALTRMSEVFFKFVDVIMKFAPLGAFGSIAFAIGSSGMSAVIALGYLLIVMYLTLAFFVVVVLGIVLRLYGFNVFRFLRYFKDEIFLLFATASSESALPRLFEKLERLGCSRQSTGLVLPTGYAFNLDGTAVYMSLCVMFVANAYGVPLSLHQQLGLLVLMLVTSKGAATVSGGTFIVFAATVTASGMLPIEGLPILFGINRFTSQAVAICNSIGNSVATLVIAKSSGEFDEHAARDEYQRVFGARPGKVI